MRNGLRAGSRQQGPVVQICIWVFVQRLWNWEGTSGGQSCAGGKDYFKPNEMQLGMVWWTGVAVVVVTSDRQGLV